MAIEKLHQRGEACLRDLLFHGSALDGLDFAVGFFLLGGRERVDVVEDVSSFVDGERGAHFAEHVVLGFACEHGVLVRCCFVWKGKARRQGFFGGLISGVSLHSSLCYSLFLLSFWMYTYIASHPCRRQFLEAEARHRQRVGREAQSGACHEGVKKPSLWREMLVSQGGEVR